eukprot:559414-Amphidinium_carterae.1
MDQSAQSVQSMMLITLGVIPLLSALNVGVSQKVMSEISQKVKFVIRVTTMRNQRKVRMSPKVKACKFDKNPSFVDISFLKHDKTWDFDTSVFVEYYKTRDLEEVIIGFKVGKNGRKTPGSLTSVLENSVTLQNV